MQLRNRLRPPLPQQNNCIMISGIKALTLGEMPVIICRRFELNKFKFTAVLAPSSSGLGHRPFKARTPVQIRLGLPKIQTDLLGRFFVGFSIVPRVRKLCIKNRHDFADSRTLLIYFFLGNYKHQGQKHYVFFV